MGNFQITILGEPMSQPRQRHGIVAGRARNWTPAKHPVNTYKAQIRLAWQQYGGQQPIAEGPVCLDVRLVFSRPKGRTWKTKPMPRYRHTSKPDAENVVKAIQDALNGLAWRDDSQIALLTVSKFVASGQEGPHTVIGVASMTECP